MIRTVAGTINLHEQSRPWYWARQVGLVVGASFFVALCARVTVPLPFTPVPLTMQNFGVLVVGLLLGSRRGAAALALYVAEGVIGLPVFSIAGQSGLAQFIGPSGGFLMAYPFTAWAAGYVFERSRRTFASAALASSIAELVLFAGGLSWLLILTHSVAIAVRFGLHAFIFGEVIKVMLASAIATRWRRPARTEA
ncbi:MAG TPA: biotin transporter BioY [Terriglobales bacterium]|nr:biotin transporter BioY [Terriglobales bacterium]